MRLRVKRDALKSPSIGAATQSQLSTGFHKFFHGREDILPSLSLRFPLRKCAWDFRNRSDPKAILTGFQYDCQFDGHQIEYS